MEAPVPKRWLLVFALELEAQRGSEIAHEVVEKDLSMDLLNPSAGSLLHGVPNGEVAYSPLLPSGFKSLGFVVLVFFLPWSASRGQRADCSVPGA